MKIGITTTVPVEVIYAAGHVPVDLNNLFITAGSPQEYVDAAEREELPANVCAWVKGIYWAVRRADDIQTLVAVVQGDCSNTHGLVELWQRRGKRVIPFSYPFGRDRELMTLEMKRFMGAFGANREAVDRVKVRLDRIRAKLQRLDEMTWREGLVTGGENHLWLVSASDFNGDPDRFERELDAFLALARLRPPTTPRIRLGYLGVPPIISDFFQVVEASGGTVVFNEMSRQFAMLEPPADLLEQYLRYTYPYDVEGRLEDIRRQVRERGLRGLIHYVQSFCFRQMEHPILARELPIPVLRIEGDRPGPMDGRTRTRLESFLEMLS